MTSAASRTVHCQELVPSESASAELLWRLPPGLGASLRDRGLAAPLQDFLARPGKSLRGRLVEECWRLCVPDAPAPTDLSTLIEWIHAGSLIVDDIQDGSVERRRAESLHLRYGIPKAINAGNALYFGALSLLATLRLKPIAELELHRRFADAMLRSHQGQALDLELSVDGVERLQIPPLVASITDLKTSRLFELAAVLGPVAAEADRRWIDALAMFGREIGAALQMFNDIEDLTGAKEPQKRHEDLRHGRLTWPWAWLAQKSNPSLFSQLAAESKRIRMEQGDWEPFARKVLSCIGDEGRQTASTRLHRALAVLAETLGPDVDLTELRAEAQRLEQSHVRSL